MRRYALAACLAGLSFAAAGRAVADEPGRLAGTWKLVGLERDGKPLPREEVADELVITSLKGGGTWDVVVKQHGKVRAEATIRPTHGAPGGADSYTKIDVAYSKGRHAGKTLHAYVLLKGDVLQAYWTRPDAGGADAVKIFHTFARAASDAAELPGAWRHVAAEREGRPLPKDEFDRYPSQLVMTRGAAARDQFTVVMTIGAEVVARATLTRCAGAAGASGNRYAATYSQGRHKGQTLHATLRVDGDTLRACWTSPDGGGEGSRRTCHTFVRVKE